MKKQQLKKSFACVGFQTRDLYITEYTLYHWATKNNQIYVYVI